MSRIDSFIGSLGASIEALKKAAVVAQDADIPEEERLALEGMQKTLKAMSDRMYDLAMTQGMVRGDMGTMHLELKDREQQ